MKKLIRHRDDAVLSSLFGMMVADIGYGLLMLLLSIIALKAFVLPRGMKRFADFS